MASLWESGGANRRNPTYRGYRSEGDTPINPIEEYLTAEKAAAILDVTPQMIRKLCHERQLPFYKVGRCIRIARPDFEQYLTSQRVGGLIGQANHGSSKAQPRRASAQLTVAQAKHAC